MKRSVQTSPAQLIAQFPDQLFRASDPARYRPATKAFCQRCERNTPTQIHDLPGGLGNCCAWCGCCRKGKPYLSKIEAQTLKRLLAAEGATHETHN